MVRFCTALERSGGSFSGLHSGSKCQIKGDEHRHHFLNPYDFEFWKKSTGSHYVWEAKPPFQAFGGHIDLWNQIRMGNNFTDLPTENFTDGEGAFFRSRKIVFWPMD
jgi:hypothetical protein